MYAPYCFCEERSGGVMRLCVAIPVHKKNIDLDDITMDAPELNGNNIVINFHVPDHRSEETDGAFFFAEDITLRSSAFDLNTLAGTNVVLCVHLSGETQANSLAFSTEQNNIIQPQGSESRSATEEGAPVFAIIQPQSSESRGAVEIDITQPQSSESR